MAPAARLALALAAALLPLSAVAQSCSTNCDLYKRNNGCVTYACSCDANGNYNLRWKLTGTGTGCKSSISWACCNQGVAGFQPAINNRCTNAKCDTGSASNNYCDSVSGMNYTIPAGSNRAIWYLHDGQFDGNVEWPYQGNSNAPCGGGSGGAKCQSNVCELRVKLQGGDGTAKCPPCDGSNPAPPPTPAKCSTYSCTAGTRIDGNIDCDASGCTNAKCCQGTTPPTTCTTGFACIDPRKPKAGTVECPTGTCTDAICCEGPPPTCASYVCPSGFSKKTTPTACAAGGCLSSNCCEATTPGGTTPTTCGTDSPSSYSCIAPRTLKVGAFECGASSSACTDALCCEGSTPPTCASYTCPGGSSNAATPSPCAASGCVFDNCCNLTPASVLTCDTYPCAPGTGTNRGSSVTCAPGGCDGTTCCDPAAAPPPPPKLTCANYTCGPNDGNSKGSGVPCADAGCTASDCCTGAPAPKTCGTYTCTSGASKGPNVPCSGSSCTASECCDPAIPITTCDAANYVCPDGYQRKAGNITCPGTCGNGLCCELIIPPPKCDTYTCTPPGSSPKPSPSTRSCSTGVCDFDTCCAFNPPTFCSAAVGCSGATPTLRDGTQCEPAGCTKSTCCGAAAILPTSLPTCGDYYGVTYPLCPSGSAYNPAAADMVADSPSTCCSPTCGNFQASIAPVRYPCDALSDYTGPDSKTSPSADACCTPKPKLPPAVATNDVRITKTGPSVPVNVSSLLDFTFTVEVVSSGAGGVPSVDFSDTLPDGFVFSDVPPAQGCTYTGPRFVACTLTNLGPNSKTTFNINVRAVMAGTWRNTAVVLGDDERTGGNNKDSADVVVLGSCCSTVVGQPACTYVRGTQQCPDSFVPDKDCTQGACAVLSQPGAPPPPDRPATCADTVPGSDPPIKFGTCPKFTTYDPSKAGVSPPSPGNCCTKTCGNFLGLEPPLPFPCSIITDYDATKNSAGSPSQATCCKEKTLSPESTNDLKLTKTGPTAPVNVGDEFDFNVKIEILSSALEGVANVRFSDTMPEGFKFAAAAPDGCKYTSDRSIECNFGTLTTTKEFKLRVRAMLAGVWTNNAAVSSDKEVPDSNNEDGHTVLILGACCDASLGQPYFCSFLNASSCFGTFLKDRPCSLAACPSLPFPGGPATCANTAPGSGALVAYKCKRGTVPKPSPGSAAPSDTACCLPTCSNTDVTSTKPKKYACDAGLEASDNPLATPPNRVTCCIDPANPNDVPDVSIVKTTRGPKSVPVGGNLTFVLTVRAVSGLSGPDNVAVVDALPVGLVPLIVEPVSLGCTISGQEVLCNIKHMDYGEEVVITITAAARQAGDFVNTAVVKLPDDSDPNNDNGKTPVTVTGACCVGARARATTRAACGRAGGVFFADKGVRQVVCRQATGSCCMADGSCSLVPSSACATMNGTWSAGGSCTFVSCPQPRGACCRTSSGTCDQTVKVQCLGVWTQGAACSDAICNPVCGAPFAACEPGVPDKGCCAGSTCKPVAQAYKKCPVTHTCQPDTQCAAEGQLCACKGGAACCAGLQCSYNWYTKQGTCQPPKTSCSSSGASCSSDKDCCRGHHCSGGKSKPLEQGDCSKSCGTDSACERKRKWCCAALKRAVKATSSEKLA
ncbi:hypothetical protein HT031_003959 [Scenedesmus sp. PABB004]|nr:hypothetical protein HT031_003959 [Scenedesmus sp. PABB004]